MIQSYNGCALIGWHGHVTELQALTGKFWALKSIHRNVEVLEVAQLEKH